MPKPSLGLVTSFTPEIFKGEYFTRIISGMIDALRNTNYDLRFIMVNPNDIQEPRNTIQEHAIEGLMFLRKLPTPEAKPPPPIGMITTSVSGKSW